MERSMTQQLLGGMKMSNIIPDRVLFLDVDGVLNSHKFLYDEGGFERQKKLDHLVRTNREFEWHDAMIDPIGIARLQKCLEATGAVVCVSSSWRKSMDFDELVAFFKRYNITVIGRTPSYHELDHDEEVDGPYARGYEIQEWLRREKDKGINYKYYAIVDDSLDAGVGHSDDVFVRTKWLEGIQDEHVEELIRILK